MFDAIVVNPLLTKAQSIPHLTAEDETSLARRYREHNDIDAAHRLVTSHLLLVSSVARELKGYKLPQEDLVQEGTIGLMKAVKTYDPDKGARLSTWATPHIRYEMYQYVMDNYGPARLVTTKPQKKLFFNIRSLRDDATKSLSIAQVNDIAERLDVKPEEVVEMEQRLYAAHLPLDRPTDDEYTNPADYLADDRFDPYDAVSEQEIERKVNITLQHALSTLSDRERDIVLSRHASETKETLWDLAAKYGISAERVNQIDRAALKKLRALTFNPEASQWNT